MDVNMVPLSARNPLSSFLTGTPTWKEAGRVLDIAGTFDDYNLSNAPDLIAHRMDVRAVGADIWLALAAVAAAVAFAAARNR